MNKSAADLTLTLKFDVNGAKSNIEAIGESVRRLGLVTESTFAKQQGKGVLGIDERQVKSNLEAIGESVKKLGLVTETTFAKQNMGVLGVKNFADVKAEMARLSTAYRDLKTSGKASTDELAKALEALRSKQRELYATISNPPKLDLARSVLGLSSGRSISLEINKVKEAYAALASSGKISLQELDRAKVAMGKRLDELKKKTNDWRESLGQIKGRAVEAAAAGAALVLSAKAGIDFESAMANVRKVIDGTPEEIASLAKELQQMARTIPLTAVELAKIATAGGQLGIAAGDIRPFVEVTAKMATAFDMTADEAGNAIGKLKNVFNLSIQEIAGFGDAINKLGNTSAARERDIVEVMLRVGGTSRQFGLAKEQTAALAAAMLSLGKPPEVAATSINSLLNRMQTATMQSKDFHEALGKIGTNAEAMAASVAADPQKALNGLLNTLEKLKGQERAEVLTGLFGREFQDDIGVLVGSLQTYRDTMQQVSDPTAYAGAMLKEFETRSATTANQLILLKNEVVRIATNIGTGLLPAIKLAAVVLTALLTPIADLAGEFPRLSAALVALGTGFVVFSTAKKVVDIAKTAILTFSGSSVPAIGRVSIAVSTLGTAMKTMGGLASAALIGWEVGKWLNTFGPIQKGMTSLIYSADRVQLAARKMWAALTGGDVTEIDRQIEIAKQAYDERLKEIDKEVADKDKPKEKPAPPPSEKPPPEQEPPPEKKTDDGSIDGFSQLELDAMDSWDEDKLTDDRKKALEKYRLAKNAGLDPNDPKLKKKRSLSNQKIDALSADQLTEGRLKEREEYYGDQLSTAERKAAEKEEKEQKKAEEKAKKEEEKDKKEAAKEEKKRLAAEKKGGKKGDGSEPSLLAKERSGQLAREKEERLAEEAKKEEDRRQAEAERRKKKDSEAEITSPSAVSGGKDEQWQKSLNNAKKYEETMQQAHEAVAESGKKSSEEWATAQEQAAEKSKSAFQKYADKVRSLQDQIIGREKSLAEELEGFDNRGTAESKWRRKAKEAKDYEKAAKAAMKAGDMEKALSLSDQAKAAYSALKGGAGSISDKMGDQAALRGVKSSGLFGIDIAKAIQQATAKTALTAMPGGDLFGDLSGRIRGQLAAVAGGSGQDQPAGKGGNQVSRVVELRFPGGSIHAPEDEAEKFLDMLAQAGMSAG